MEFLKDASEYNRHLGAPVTAEQLLLCADKLKQCNTLQLEQLLDDLGLVEEEEQEEEEEEDVGMVNGRFCSLLVD